MSSTSRVLAGALVVGGLALTAGVAPGAGPPAPSGATSASAPPHTATATTTAMTPTCVTYALPVPGAAVSRPYDAPAQPWLPGHRGVDLAAVEGTAVLAAADGVVAFAGSVAGRPVVSVDHADGVRTTYEPVLPVVTAGQVVLGGQSLGTLAAGHDGGTALHWGARTGPRTYVDPMSLLGPTVVRLLE